MKKQFFAFWFRLFGWKIVGHLPQEKKYVVIVAPHTSNYDFFVGLAARSIVGLHSEFLGKKSLFTIPILGAFMRAIGGHPVDRSKHSNLVDQVVSLFDKNERFVIALAPEGTRSFNPNWKTGFYHIAMKAQVPIVMVGFDFATKTVIFNDPLYPSGDLEKDLGEIKAYFRTIKGKHPEKGVV